MRVEGSGGERPVVLVAAIPEEVRVLLRRVRGRRRLAAAGGRSWEGFLSGQTVVVVVTGGGRAAARTFAREAMERFSPRLWIGLGFAGAVSGDLTPGTVVAGMEIVDARGAPIAALDRGVAERVLAAAPEAVHGRFIGVDRPVATPEQKALLFEAIRPGLPAAVDMESAGWAEAASSTPGVLVRAISDTAAESIPRFVVERVSPAGVIDRGAILRHAVRHPSSIGKLLALRRRARLCASRLADVLERFAARGF